LDNLVQELAQARLGKKMRNNCDFFSQVYTERLTFDYICFFFARVLFAILGFTIGIGLGFRVQCLLLKIGL